MEDRKTTLVKKKLIFSENRSAKWRKQDEQWGIIRYKGKNIGIKTGSFDEEYEDDFHDSVSVVRTVFILDFSYFFFDHENLVDRIRYLINMSHRNRCSYLYIYTCCLL